jgi:hypothetical protein
LGRRAWEACPPVDDAQTEAQKKIFGRQSPQPSEKSRFRKEKERKRKAVKAMGV